MRVRTAYSFRYAVGRLAPIMERIASFGWPAAPITDRDSTFGFRRWRDLAKASGLRPVYGVEIGCEAALGDKKQSLIPFVFLATRSLASLHSLVSLSSSHPGKSPSLTFDQAFGANGVVTLAGETFIPPEGMDVKGRPFLLSPASPIGAVRKQLAAGMIPVASSINAYLNEGDGELHRLTLSNSHYSVGGQTYPQWLLSDDEWFDATKRLAPDGVRIGALRTRNAIMNECGDAAWPLAALPEPNDPTPIRVLCERGAKRLGISLTGEYGERLERELSVIAAKNFEAYFQIVAQLTSWARSRMAVGPARGSSCGSLVCYLLGITAIDPIPDGLIFERFIDLNRKDLPDIDIDFSDEQRHLVFEQLQQWYGPERVARLGTVVMFQPRSALRKIAMNLDVPIGLASRVADALPNLSTGDSRYGHALEDAFTETEAARRIVAEYPALRLAEQIENTPSTAGVHASALVLTNAPIAEHMATDARRTGATHCDKEDAEAIGMLKLDLLGLTQLSVFERIARMLKIEDIDAWLTSIPLDDPAAFAIFSQNKFAGVFQFNGAAVKNISGMLEFERLDDVVSITALARPGPLATGGTYSWLRRRRGMEAVPAKHPLIAALTADTYGVVMYQETVMRITREVGQFSWEDTSAIRKLMSKSQGNEKFAKYAQQFVEGAAVAGLGADEASALWDEINTFGSWAFNKSHAVAYGRISYWCAWMKAHHPLQFACATLDAAAQEDKVLLLRELEAEGVRYLPFCARRSGMAWSIDEEENVLIAPLTERKGVGPETARAAIALRDAGAPLTGKFKKALEPGPTNLDTLYPLRDWLASTWPDLRAANIITKPTPIGTLEPGKEVVIVCIIDHLATRDENHPVEVLRRGYRVTGPQTSLRVLLKDDTGEIKGMIGRRDFERVGRPIYERGEAGKHVYALKGKMGDSFPFVFVERAIHLGRIEGEKDEPAF